MYAPPLRYKREALATTQGGQAIQHTVDVGYYAPADRTTLNLLRSLCSCIQIGLILATPELILPQGLGRCILPPGWVYHPTILYAFETSDFKFEYQDLYNLKSLPWSTLVFFFWKFICHQACEIILNCFDDIWQQEKSMVDTFILYVSVALVIEWVSHYLLLQVFLLNLGFKKYSLNYMGYVYKWTRKTY